MGGDQLSKAPLIVRESLLFPYIQGFFFCLDLRQQGKRWQNINHAFKNLPLSTEHILHPEKYLSEKDPPLDFKIPDFSLILGKEWKVCSNNVMGEFGCQILFRQFQNSSYQKIAAGWGGDRYVVYQHKNGAIALLWLTIWDSQQDAQEFAQGYNKLITKKYKAKDSEVSVKIIEQENKVFILEKIPEASLPLLVEKLKTIEIVK